MKTKLLIVKLTQFFDALLLITLPTQLGHYFFSPESFLNGVRIDYLAPQITIFDLVFLMRILVEAYIFFQTQYQHLAITQPTPSALRHRLLVLFKKYSRDNWPLLILICSSFLISTRSILIFYKIAKIWQCFALYFIFRKSKISFRMISWILFSTVLIHFVLAIVQVTSGHSGGGFWYYLGERLLDKNSPAIATSFFSGKEFLRAYSTFSHPNSMGGFFLLWYFYFSTFAKNERHSKLLDIVQILCICLVLLSFSQLAISILIILVSYNFLHKLSCKACFVAKLFMLIAVMGLFLYISFEHDSLDKRSYYAMDAVQLIKNSPLGVGIGNYIPASNTLPKSADWWQAGRQPVHNIFLLFTSEIGWWGWILLLVYIRKNYSLPKFDKDIFNFLLIIALIGMWDHYPLTLNQNFQQFPILLALMQNVKINS